MSHNVTNRWRLWSYVPKTLTTCRDILVHSYLNILVQVWGYSFHSSPLRPIFHLILFVSERTHKLLIGAPDRCEQHQACALWPGHFLWAAQIFCALRSCPQRAIAHAHSLEGTVSMTHPFSFLKFLFLTSRKHVTKKCVRRGTWCEVMYHIARSWLKLQYTVTYCNLLMLYQVLLS